jgi:hypothetical protein
MYWIGADGLEWRPHVVEIMQPREPRFSVTLARSVLVRLLSRNVRGTLRGVRPLIE